MANHGFLLQLYFVLFLIFIIMNIGAYISFTFYNFLPLPAHAPSTLYNPLIYAVNFIFGVFDKSFIFLVLFTIAVDWVSAYFDPSVIAGFINILSIFIITFIFAQFSGFLGSVNVALASNTLLPNTYAFMTSNYYLFVFLFAFGLGAILNFNGVRHK